MTAAAECILGRAISRRTARTRTLEVVEPVKGPVRQDRNDSPLLHPDAGAALALAASPLEDGPRPVAVVLADGTVRSLEEGRSGQPYTSGRLSGSGWTFWWERRAFSPNA